MGTSPFTAEQLKAYKGLEAYNQVLEGWVRDIKVKSFGDKRLLAVKVRSFTSIAFFVMLKAYHGCWIFTYLVRY